MKASLRRRMGLLFLAFFFLVLISVAASFWTIYTQSKDSLVINLAGRQRMLVQQMTTEALQIEKGGGQEHIRSLQEAVDTFDQTLWALTNGGQVPYLSDQTVSVPATRHSNILAALTEVRNTWDTLQPNVDVIVAEEPENPNFVSAIQAVERLSSHLVQQADDVVRMYESASAQKVTRLRWIQAAFFVSALVNLAIGFAMTRKSVLEPLRVLGLSAERIGRGNLSVSVKVQGPREIMMLANSFDEMRAQLKTSTEELEVRVNRRTRELSALTEVTREISSRLDINHVLHSVTDKARDLLGGEVALLCLLNESEQVLSLEAFAGPKQAVSGKRVASRASLASQVLAGDGAIACGMGECEGVCGIMAPAFRMSHLAAPLRVSDRVIGALCVGSPKAAAFAGGETSLLTELANSAAIALENARLYQQAERLATLEERQRIAAEMHDGLAQTLSYLELKSEQLIELIHTGHTEKTTGELKRMREAISQAGQHAREAITNLHERTPLRLSLQDRLAEAVDQFAKTSGPSVNLVDGLDLPVIASQNETEQVIRVIREALQNVGRHAQASDVTVRLGRLQTEFIITVEDNGLGFDPEALPVDGRRHFGLSIMRARANRIGGQVTYHSEPGQGTLVTLTWPCRVLTAGPAWRE